MISCRCDTFKDPDAIAIEEQRFRTALDDIADMTPLSEDRSVVIPVAWHVISKNSGLAGGNIPMSMIQDSIAATNQHFG